MTETAPEPFDFGDYIHLTGDKGCGPCWDGYPKPCDTPECTGLIHANFGDEGWDSYWLDTKCDVCGEAE